MTVHGMDLCASDIPVACCGQLSQHQKKKAKHHISLVDNRSDTYFSFVPLEEYRTWSMMDSAWSRGRSF
jgi:hypothetical protein